MHDGKSFICAFESTDDMREFETKVASSKYRVSRIDDFKNVNGTVNDVIIFNCPVNRTNFIKFVLPMLLMKGISVWMVNNLFIPDGAPTFYIRRDAITDGYILGSSEE